MESLAAFHSQYGETRTIFRLLLLEISCHLNERVNEYMLVFLVSICYRRQVLGIC